MHGANVHRARIVAVADYLKPTKRRATPGSQTIAWPLQPQQRRRHTEQSDKKDGDRGISQNMAEHRRSPDSSEHLRRRWRATA